MENIKFKVFDANDDMNFSNGVDKQTQPNFIDLVPQNSSTSVDKETDIKMTTPEVSVDVETVINNYNTVNKPHLYILTPCYGGMCHIDYVMSLMATKEVFAKYNIRLTIEFCKNDSLVSRARNNLIARAMHNPTTTHILFIDNDITWNPYDIIKLLLSDKELLGGLYPIKRYMWDRLANEPDVIRKWIDKKNASFLKDKVSNEDVIKHNLLKYNINYLSNELQIVNNLCKVRHLATGFMMIKRNVIEKMSKAYPSTKYVDDVSFLNGTENDFAFALFDCGVEFGHYLSEDWMFSERAMKIGFEIYVDVTINLIHTGNEDYMGNFISTIV